MVFCCLFIFKSVPVILPFKECREVTDVGMCVRPGSNLQNVTVLGQPRKHLAILFVLLTGNVLLFFCLRISNSAIDKSTDKLYESRKMC